MKKEMLINVLQPEECRIAILEDGVLEELYVERTSQESYVGNIYKGRIVNIEPSIQAAFVDFGVGRNGFLHVSDVEPTYYRHLEPWRSQPEGRRGFGGRDRHRTGTRSPERRPREHPRDEPFDLESAEPVPPPEIFETPSDEHPPQSRSHGKRSRRGRRKERPAEHLEGPEVQPSGSEPFEETNPGDISSPHIDDSESHQLPPSTDEPPAPRLMDSAE